MNKAVDGRGRDVTVIMHSSGYVFLVGRKRMAVFEFYRQLNP